MFQRTGLIALAAAATLTACGGGGSSDSTPLPPQVPSTAEGIWKGSTSTGHGGVVLVLENGDTWGLYGTNSNIPSGALHGHTESNAGKLFGTGRAFDFNSGTQAPGGYNGTYTVNGTIDVSLPGSLRFTGSYDAAYGQAATPAAVAGAYAGGVLVSGASPQAVTVAISASGALTIPAIHGCSASGSLVPRASGKNVYDVTVTFSGATCTVPSGTPIKGVGYYDAASHRLFTAGLRASEDAGFMFMGSKM